MSEGDDKLYSKSEPTKQYINSPYKYMHLKLNCQKSKVLSTLIVSLTPAINRLIRLISDLKVTYNYVSDLNEIL